jgi:nucleoside-diphosphate-sugar epimerase
MNILVVGGAGFVGGALTDVLLSYNHHVRVFDSLLYEDSYLKPFAFARGDVRDTDALRPQLLWADCVVWLAARVAEATCDLDPVIAEQVNVGAVQALCAGFDGRIIFTSTSAVYGRSAEILDERSALGPRTLYSRTKALAEQELQRKNAIAFRLGTLFGLGDQFSRPRFDLVVNTMALAAATKRRITVFGGAQYRPFLHVKDAADAILRAVHGSETGVFNLSAENLRIADLGLRLLDHFPDLTIETKPERGQSESYRMSSEKARELLGFAPRRSIDDGIVEIRELVESGRIPDLDNPRFRNHLFLEQKLSRSVAT